jgi:hypothetical protein
MRETGIRVEKSKTYKVTTNSKHSFNIAPNLLNRDVDADQPNKTRTVRARPVPLKDLLGKVYTNNANLRQGCLPVAFGHIQNGASRCCLVGPNTPSS